MKMHLMFMEQSKIKKIKFVIKFESYDSQIDRKSNRFKVLDWYFCFCIYMENKDIDGGEI